MIRDASKVICDIIKNYMILDANQIWLYNQDYKIPNTLGLFVIIQFLGGRPSSISESFSDNISGGLQETLIVNMINQYQIDIQSKNNDAKGRKEEIIMALNSTISQQMQEKYQFKIANITNTFSNTSLAEDPSMYTKFSININVFEWKNKTKDVDYYNQFDISDIKIEN